MAAGAFGWALNQHGHDATILSNPPPPVKDRLGQSV